ncbi:hypothetical protein FY528_05620 [Hymenobacter lutimineralis]|uniref:DUF349 domain-containing protein n=1 Tax=Hymenobacter lutimineralis TaxID=2606448 RepID=A0A5D6V9A7_9BACT|nr:MULTISPECIES: hypothetical protein [Hymenobacter]QIX62601.1 hypothetical protein HER32_16035 [Hymenobacter sp. BT18]TYZ11837.1 hypothetical protein FY528_05620 [Hymenobacter lutimineralis]
MKRCLLSLAVLAALGLTPLAAAAQQSTSSTTPTSSAVERDLRTFVDWVSEKMDKAEAGARREWPKMMADFDRQSQRLDRATDSLSVQSKREYAAEKARYKAWAAEQRRLEAQAREPETAQQAQDRLLNENVVINRARATELPDLYERLLATTREQRRQWTQRDWAAASEVLSRLNGRYEQVRQQLGLEERLRIRTLQGEFRTLEGARATKEYLSEKE